MRTLVVYYSLSGTTRRLATTLAREFSAETEEIRCERYSLSPWGAMRAAFDSWRGRLPAVAPPAHDLAQYDLVVIGGPIWAFHASTPLRAYLKAAAGRLKAVAFFLTHGGSPPEQALSEMTKLAGIAPNATLVLREEEVKRGEFGPAVSRFVLSLVPREVEVDWMPRRGAARRRG